MIELKNVSFSYADSSVATLENLSVTIPTGSFVAIVGDNGAGKSTFCKLLNGIIPTFIDGELSGEIRVQGVKVREKNPAVLAKTVGYVYQDFENQLLRPKVLDDASFSLLNMGEEAYEKLTMTILEALDLDHLADEYVWQLSGGQKHLLALAGVLVLSPEVLVLDEPIAQLDPYHAKKIYEQLAALHRQGKTIIVIEHNTAFIGEYCDHVLFMKERNIHWFLPVKEALQRVEELTSGGIFPPQVTLLGHELVKRGLQPAGTLPITIHEALPYLQPLEARISRQGKEVAQAEVPPLRQTVLNFQEVHLEYKKINDRPHPVITQLNLTIHRGDRVAIIGNNGAGKSSLLKMTVGLLKPKRGEIRLKEQLIHRLKAEEISNVIGYVYQNPEGMFIEDSIEKDIAFSMRARGIKDYQTRTEMLLTQFDLLALRHRDGRLLSGGQMRRASLAIGVALSPQILLLDEPTASLDMATRKRITSTLQTLSESIETVMIATHDMQLVSEWANRIIVMNEGVILADGPREAIFQDTHLLERAGIVVPEIVQLSQQLSGAISYSVEEFVHQVEQGGRI